MLAQSARASVASYTSAIHLAFPARPWCDNKVRSLVCNELAIQLGCNHEVTPLLEVTGSR